MLDFDAAETLARRYANLRLIAIDGLPLAGKSTLAARLAAALDADILYLDDFVRPEAEWRGRTQPGFPFPYVRYDDFLKSVEAVARTGTCNYLAYDWDRADTVLPRSLGGARPVIVEGVSALHPRLAPLYGLRFWVDSDASTTLAASLERGVGDWGGEWRDLFLPSVDLYLATKLQDRADQRIAGRGFG